MRLLLALVDAVVRDGGTERRPDPGRGRRSWDSGILAKHDLTEAIFEEVKQLLTEKRLYVKAGCPGIVHS